MQRVVNGPGHWLASAVGTGFQTCSACPELAEGAKPKGLYKREARMPVLAGGKL